MVFSSHGVSGCTSAKGKSGVERTLNRPISENISKAEVQFEVFRQEKDIAIKFIDAK